LNSVPDTLAGTASGVFNTSRQLGGALAVAVFGALLAQPGGFDLGLRLSLLIAAGISIGAAATSTRLTTPAHVTAQTRPLVRLGVTGTAGAGSTP
jgi:sugar phosphate permease